MARGFSYQGQMSTRITREEPLPDNPYVAGARFTFGYANTDLVRHCRYPEVIFLLLRGELPAAAECRLLEALLVGLCNPGPNHPAVRAAMTAGLSKSNPEHLLPLGLMVAGEVRTLGAAWDFLWRWRMSPAQDCAGSLPTPGEWEPVAPGFGHSFGAPDPLLAQLAASLLATGDWPHLIWACRFVECVAPMAQGWRISGLVAAVALDLGLDARQAVALYQIALGPAVLAHGLEQTHHPITAGPLLDDRDYELL